MMNQEILAIQKEQMFLQQLFEKNQRILELLQENERLKQELERKNKEEEECFILKPLSLTFR